MLTMLCLFFSQHNPVLFLVNITAYFLVSVIVDISHYCAAYSQL
jgi:hypothetical protein